ncbi:hypothetical protein ACLB2K_029037 [Fragaria x ananassa]
MRNSFFTISISLNGATSTRDRVTWIEAEKTWKAYASVPRDFCDRYGLCGPNANCIISNNPVCQCLQGFEPKSPEKWNLTGWSLGCVRNKPLSCQESDKDEFVKFTNLKLPDTTYSWVNRSMNIKECRAKCLNSCTCMAYTSSDISDGGSGCAIWFGDLLDIRKFPDGGQDLYIRMSASEIDDGKVKTGIIVAAVIAAVFSGMLFVGHYFHRSRTKLKEKQEENQSREGAQKEDLELPL